MRKTSRSSDSLHYLKVVGHNDIDDNNSRQQCFYLLCPFMLDEWPKQVKFSVLLIITVRVYKWFVLLWFVSGKAYVFDDIYHAQQQTINTYLNSFIDLSQHWILKIIFNILQKYNKSLITYQSPTLHNCVNKIAII